MNFLIYMATSYLQENWLAFLITFLISSTVLFMVFYFSDRNDLKDSLFMSLLINFVLYIVYFLLSFSGNFILGKTKMIDEKELDQVISIQAAIKNGNYTPDQKAIINKGIKLTAEKGTMYEYEFEFLKAEFDHFQKENSEKVLSQKIKGL